MALGDERLLRGDEIVQRPGRGRDRPNLAALDTAHEVREHARRRDRRAREDEVPQVECPEVEADRRPSASWLADDLRSVCTALVKAYLAEDFEAAFDLTLFQMGRSVFTHGYTPHALDIGVHQTAAGGIGSLRIDGMMFPGRSAAGPNGGRTGR